MLPLPPGGVPHLLALAAVAALVGGLSAVDRKGAFQLMLSRPLVLSAIMGWALGDSRSGLLLGVPLELLFLGGVNLGGSLPENEALLAAALTATVVPAGIAAHAEAAPALFALGLALFFPLAVFGRWLERAIEVRNGALFDEAMRGTSSIAVINLRGLLLPFGASAGICALAVLISPLLAQARLMAPEPLLPALEGSWHAVWAVGAAAAIRAIREPRAPIIAAVSAAAVMLGALALRGLS